MSRAGRVMGTPTSWIRRLILVLLVFAAVLVALGTWMHAQAAVHGCPDWPLCHGKAIPSLEDSRTLLQWVHRIMASLVGLLHLLLVGLLALFPSAISSGTSQGTSANGATAPTFRSLRDLGLLALALVLLQGTLVSRVGVLVSVAQREALPFGMEPWALAGGALAAAVFVLWSARRAAQQGAVLLGLALVACELVELQSSMGAAMVLWRSTVGLRLAHGLGFLVYLMVVIALLHRTSDGRRIHLACRGGKNTPLVVLRRVTGCERRARPVRPRRAYGRAYAAFAVLAALAQSRVFLHPLRQQLGWLLVVFVAQMSLGSLVRHTEAGFVCGDTALKCAGVWWPSFFAGQLHMAHRLAGVLGVGAGMVILWGARREHPIIVWTAVALCALPLLGAAVVWSGGHAAWRAAHTVVAHGVFAALCWIWMKTRNLE